MERHFVHELELLKTNLIKMGSLAEHAVAESMRAFIECHKDIAQQVLDQDWQINSYEITIDNAVVDLLALHQPVATDLRFILAASKISNDLERIGDHAVNIAESAMHCADLPATMGSSDDISQMAQITKGMLRDAIDGFIHKDPSKCKDVLRSDDTIDDLNRKVAHDLVKIMRKDVGSIDRAMELIRISRNLERIADLATNISEEVIYMADAQVIKHHFADKRGAGH